MHQLRYDPYLSDENYILPIRAGGPAGELAIISLYTKYCKEVQLHIKGWQALHTSCKSEPQDVLHDAFIIMIHKIQCETFGTMSLKAYWIGVSKKLLLNQVKKNGRIHLVEEPVEPYGFEEMDPECLFLIEERNAEIHKCLTTFGSRCKDILILWASRYTMDEIACRLHLSGAPMARKIKHSCFKKFKSLVMKNKNLCQ
jgi:DNA-directed RNA polymerase specialized sigma24 family protein